MVKEFMIGASHTINIGNYESLRVEASVTTICEESNREPVLHNAQDLLKYLIEQTFENQKKPDWFSRIPGKRNKTA